MCIWNRRNPEDRVHFLGFDEQQPELDHAALKGHLKRFRLPANDVRVRGMDASCSLSIADRLYDQEDYDECVKRLDQLSRYFDRREKVLIQRTSAEELETRSKRECTIWAKTSSSWTSISRGRTRPSWNLERGI